VITNRASTQNNRGNCCSSERADNLRIYRRVTCERWDTRDPWVRDQELAGRSYRNKA